MPNLVSLPSFFKGDTGPGAISDKNPGIVWRIVRAIPEQKAAAIMT